jgi:hypothetical protein
MVDEILMTGEAETPRPGDALKRYGVVATRTGAPEMYDRGVCGIHGCRMTGDAVHGRLVVVLVAARAASIDGERQGLAMTVRAGVVAVLRVGEGELALIRIGYGELERLTDRVPAWQKLLIRVAAPAGLGEFAGMVTLTALPDARDHERAVRLLRAMAVGALDVAVLAMRKDECLLGRWRLLPRLLS